MMRLVTTLLLLLLSASSQAQSYAERYARQCSACHGAEGKGVPNLAPSLAGQHSFYAITQLFLFKNGRRVHQEMEALAKTFSNDDLRGFSDFIATLPAQTLPTPGPVPDSVRMQQGRDLAGKHQCFSCHGKDLDGGKQVPRLAGQHEDYLLRSMEQFLGGKRIGYTSAMNEALSGLKGDELAALAHFMANFPRNP